MYLEAQSASDAVRAQLREDAQQIAKLGAVIRSLAPRAVVTCARGSSDHAATYAKYLIETRARVLTASAAPSVSSVYGIDQDLRGCLFIAISQSGRSPDLLASVARRRSRARRSSPVQQPRCAARGGRRSRDSACAPVPSVSVAATKSYLATLAALARLVAAWTRKRFTARGACRRCPICWIAHGNSTGLARCRCCRPRSISTSSAAASASARRRKSR